MESNSRVLAYSLAKEISLEELKNVSGGATSNLTGGGSTRPTGHYLGVDIEADASIDW